MPIDPRQLDFWNAEENDFWDIINELIVMTLHDGAMEGIMALPANLRVLADMNWINQNVLNYVRTYRFSWIKSITDTIRTQVQQAIMDWMREGSPLSALENRLTPIFGQVRAEMIAATETTRVYQSGNQAAWEASGIVSKMVWRTAEDDLVCDICGPMEGVEIGIGDIDAQPPAHSNCRCSSVPVVDDNLVKAKFDKINS